MKVLALGEREGGLSFYFASKGCEVTCSDYNEFPDTTKAFHLAKGVADNIEYAQVDMREIPYSDDQFDVVVFKSVLGSVGNKDDQDKAMKEIYRVLKPGGAFLFAENAVASRVHRYMRKRFVNWGDRWRYISRKEIKEWVAPYKEQHLKSYGTSAVFGRNESQRAFLAGLDVVMSPITPSAWRYIFFGVMIK